MNKRVIEIIENKKLTPSRFADKIGVPRSTISHIISGRNKPSMELITKIADYYPDISLDWLIKGKGDMIETQTSLFDESFEQIKKPETTSSPAKTENAKTNLHLETELIDSAKSNKEQTSEKKHEPESQDIKVSVSKIILVYNDDTFKVLKPQR